MTVLRTSMAWCRVLFILDFGGVHSNSVTSGFHPSITCRFRTTSPRSFGPRYICPESDHAFIVSGEAARWATRPTDPKDTITLIHRRARSDEAPFSVAPFTIVLVTTWEWRSDIANVNLYLLEKRNAVSMAVQSVPRYLLESRDFFLVIRLFVLVFCPQCLSGRSHVLCGCRA